MGIVLGLTGGIATGKSTAVEVFRRHGVPIIDGDVIAREVVEPGSEGLAAITNYFGKDILQADGTLNRQKLGAIVFSNQEKRRQLDLLLNPFIRSEINRRIEESREKYPLTIADIPLLFEGKYQYSVDLVAVVYVPEKIQLQRLMKRNNLSEKDAQQRINSQWPIEDKKEMADVIFDNRQTKESLVDQINTWMHEEITKVGDKDREKQ